MRYRILWKNPSYEDAIPVATTSCFMFIGKGKIRKLNRSSMNQKFSNTTGSKRVRSGKSGKSPSLVFLHLHQRRSQNRTTSKSPCTVNTHPISCACCATFSPVSNETGMWKCSVCLVWIYCPSANQAFPTPLSSSWATVHSCKGTISHVFVLPCSAFWWSRFDPSGPHSKKWILIKSVNKFHTVWKPTEVSLMLVLPIGSMYGMFTYMNGWFVWFSCR